MAELFLDNDEETTKKRCLIPLYLFVMQITGTKVTLVCIITIIIITTIVKIIDISDDSAFFCTAGLVVRNRGK